MKKQRKERGVEVCIITQLTALWKSCHGLASNLQNTAAPLLCPKSPESSRAERWSQSLYSQRENASDQRGIFYNVLTSP